MFQSDDSVFDAGGHAGRQSGGQHGGQSRGHVGAGGRRSSSVIDELFAFQLVSGRVCDTCHQLSVNIQPSYMLMLSIPQTQTATTHVAVAVDSCLRQFSATQRLTRADHVHCVRCARDQLTVDRGCVVGGRDILACMHVGTRDVYRQASHVTGSSCQTRSMLHHCPPYLIIQLLRFNAQSKLTTPVVVQRRLLLGNDVVMGDDDVSQYEIRALCCHVDSHVVSSGHYVTYATADDVRWYKFDDVTVTKVNIDQELMTDLVQQNVYLLFYRRVTS